MMIADLGIRPPIPGSNLGQGARRVSREPSVNGLPNGSRHPGARLQMESPVSSGAKRLSHSIVKCESRENGRGERRRLLATRGKSWTVEFKSLPSSAPRGNRHSCTLANTDGRSAADLSAPAGQSGGLHVRVVSRADSHGRSRSRFFFPEESAGRLAYTRFHYVQPRVLTEFGNEKPAIDTTMGPAWHFRWRSKMPPCAVLSPRTENGKEAAQLRGNK